MAHRHSLYDTDAHFKINEHSREILNAGDTEPVLFQGDHNSELFTFEIPRTIDGHDMSLCNSVKIHYSNIGSSTRYSYSDVYEVTDLQVNPDDENVLICSWLITSNATRYVGSLQFSFSFKCTDEDGAVEYVWSTAICKDIDIRETFNNSEQVVGLYSDVLEAWRTQLFENNKVLVITTSLGDDGSMYADRTPQEITSAYKDGYACVLVNASVGHVYSFYNGYETVDGKTVACFSRIYYENTTDKYHGLCHEKATVLDDGKVSFNLSTPAKTPNPHSLTINGTSYDGSEAVNITVEGGSSDLYIVNIPVDENHVCTSDKTTNEIAEASASGKVVYANVYQDSAALLVPLIMATESQAMFATTIGPLMSSDIETMGIIIEGNAGTMITNSTTIPTTDELVSEVIAKLPVYGGETE